MTYTSKSTTMVRCKLHSLNYKLLKILLPTVSIFEKMKKGKKIIAEVTAKIVRRIVLLFEFFQ